MINRSEIAETLRKAVSFYRYFFISGFFARRNNNFDVAFLFFRRHKSDKSFVKVFGLRLFKQLIRRTCGKYLAVIHSNQPIKPRGFFHISCRDHNAHIGTFFADIVDQVPELTP